MPTLTKITLSHKELSDLRKIQDNYNAEKATVEDKLRLKMMGFWQEVRLEHGLDDIPFHVMGADLWLLRDASNDEQEAFLKMTSYK